MSHTALEFSQHRTILLVTHLNEVKRFQQLSSIPTQFIPGKPKQIKPGERYVSNESLTFKLNQIFPEPGEYLLQIALQDNEHEHEIGSNPLQIQILEPTGINLQAYKFLQTFDRSFDLFSGAGLYNNQLTQSKLEEFVAAYSESVYGDYAAYTLGELYYHQKEYLRAEHQFLKLAAKSNFSLKEKAEVYLNRTKDKLRELGRSN